MIESYTGRAPRAGMVVYGETGGWNSPRRKIAESDQISSGNVVIRIPDLSAMKVEVQINELDVARLRTLSPRIIDNFQVYLRELRVEDLRGSAGIYRLREELLARVNAAVHPTKVKDVLFKDMLVQ